MGTMTVDSACAARSGRCAGGVTALTSASACWSPAGCSMHASRRAASAPGPGSPFLDAFSSILVRLVPSSACDWSTSDETADDSSSLAREALTSGMSLFASSSTELIVDVRKGPLT